MYAGYIFVKNCNFMEQALSMKNKKRYLRKITIKNIFLFSMNIQNIKTNKTELHATTKVHCIPCS